MEQTIWVRHKRQPRFFGTVPEIGGNRNSAWPLLKFYFSDGSAPSYATETRMEERINPADEAKIKMPRKREAENTKQMPDGAKGPKFTKKQMEKEVNKRSAAQFGNLTDY